MASKARADAARRNGAKSKGPVTAEGKARSSKNAVTHGLYTDVILLQGENAELFARLHQVITDIYKPRNEEECMLVRDLVHNRWKLERMRQYHSAAIDDELTQQAPEIDRHYKWMHYSTRGARAFRELCDQSRTLEMYERMDTRLQNAILRLGKYIRDLQKHTPDAGGGITGSNGQGQTKSGSSATPVPTSTGAAAASAPVSLAQVLARDFFLPAQQKTAAPRTPRIRTPKPAVPSPENEHPEIGNEPSEAPKYFVAGAASAYSPEPVLSPENEHPEIGNEPSEAPKYFVAGAASAYSPEPDLSPENEYPVIGNEPSEAPKYFVAGAASAYSPEPVLSPENEYPTIGNEPSEAPKYFVAGAASAYSPEPDLSPENEYPVIGNEPSEAPKYFVAGAGAASTATHSPEPILAPPSGPCRAGITRERLVHTTTSRPRQSISTRSAAAAPTAGPTGRPEGHRPHAP